jgi:hypothetical protein
MPDRILCGVLSNLNLHFCFAVIVLLLPLYISRMGFFTNPTIFVHNLSSTVLQSFMPAALFARSTVVTSAVNAIMVFEFILFGYIQLPQTHSSQASANPSK